MKGRGFSSTSTYYCMGGSQHHLSRVPRCLLTTRISMYLSVVDLKRERNFDRVTYKMK